MSHAGFCCLLLHASVCLKVREMAEAKGVEVAVEGTSTLRKLERYRKLMGKKQGEHIKSYAAFIKVGVRTTRRSHRTSCARHLSA